MNILDLQKKLAPVLSPLAGVYSLLMRARQRLWNSPCLPRFKAPCLCVSVGNISWGGTGKTPLVGWLMDWATKEQIKVAVLTRGYKAHLKFTPTRVTSRHTPREVGDEPLMLSLAHPKVPVLVDPNRSRAANYALASLHPDLLLLDDGMQHLAMARDLDLVVLRPEDLKDEWNRVIPAGSWREGSSALSRAGAFLVKCDPQTMHALSPVLTRRLESLGKPVFSFFLHPLHLRRVGGDETLSAQECQGKAYILLTGVGQPKQVLATVNAYMGYAPDEHLIFPDHHRYSFQQVEKLSRRNKLVICTSKDAAKLRSLPAPNMWYLQTQVRFGPAIWTDKTFPDWWALWWKEHYKERAKAQDGIPPLPTGSRVKKA